MPSCVQVLQGLVSATTTILVLRGSGGVGLTVPSSLPCCGSELCPHVQHCELLGSGACLLPLESP